MNPEAYRAQLADLANGTRPALTVAPCEPTAIYRPHLQRDSDPLPVVVQSRGVSAWASKRRPKKTVTESDE